MVAGTSAFVAVKPFPRVRVQDMDHGRDIPPPVVSWRASAMTPVVRPEVDRLYPAPPLDAPLVVTVGTLPLVLQGVTCVTTSRLR